MLTQLKNIDTVVSCDGRDMVYHHVDLWFENGTIKAIGALDAVADEVFDCSDMIVYPGLINVHHHLYQYFTRNLKKVQNYELFDWLKALYGVWKNLSDRTVLLSSTAAMAELMRSWSSGWRVSTMRAMRTGVRRSARGRQRAM